MEGCRLSYPHPDWKAWDFYDPASLLSPSRFIEVQAWHTRHDDIVVPPFVVSDQVYVLNQELGSTYYSGSGIRSLLMRPKFGYNQYDRVGNKILWKRIVLRLILETTNDQSIIERRPEVLRISLVYSRVPNGAGHEFSTDGEAPVRWGDVYTNIAADPLYGHLGVHNELNLANRRNILVLKEWMFCEGSTDLHIDPLQGLGDVIDRTLRKTFVEEMDLPDLPNEWGPINPDDAAFGHFGLGDLCLLVNSTEPLVAGLSRSRYRIKFSGRLYFVDAE